MSSRTIWMSRRRIIKGMQEERRREKAPDKSHEKTRTSFEVSDEVEGAGDEDTKDGDRPVTDTRAPAVNRPAISDEAKEKLVGLKINNLPLEITEQEVVKLSKDRIKPDIESVNFEMTRTERNTQLVIFSGPSPS